MKKQPVVSKFGMTMARLEIALTLIYLALKILLLVLKLAAIAGA